MHRPGLPLAPRASRSRGPRLRVPRCQQRMPCRDACASSFLDDFGPGSRTLRRYWYGLRLEVRNDRYSVLRSRAASGAKARMRTEVAADLPSTLPGGRRLGRCLSPNWERAERCGASGVFEPSSYFKQASTESNALVSVAVTQ